jgi:CRISPR-associated protein Cas2
MYIFLIYDITEKKCGKILKICRVYLNRIQNSVFEGEITESNLKKLKFEIDKVIDKKYDSIMIFKMRSKIVFKKEIMGVEKFPIENIF